MNDTDTVLPMLEALTDMNVRISVDDFGTGYSSLAYLKRFPLHNLKVDRSFVSGVPDHHDSVAITQAVVAMAHSLGMKVTAEGVETQAQSWFLQQIGCDMQQGYLFSRPLDPGDYARRLGAVSARAFDVRRSVDARPAEPAGDRRRRRRIDLDAVLAFVLRAIERTVGGFDQQRRRQAGHRHDGRAADADRHGVAGRRMRVPQPQRLDREADLPAEQRARRPATWPASRPRIPRRRNARRDRPTGRGSARWSTRSA